MRPISAAITLLLLALHAAPTTCKWGNSTPRATAWCTIPDDAPRLAGRRVDAATRHCCGGGGGGGDNNGACYHARTHMCWGHDGVCDRTIDFDRFRACCEARADAGAARSERWRRDAEDAAAARGRAEADEKRALGAAEEAARRGAPDAARKAAEAARRTAEWVAAVEAERAAWAAAEAAGIGLRDKAKAGHRKRGIVASITFSMLESGARIATAAREGTKTYIST